MLPVKRYATLNPADKSSTITLSGGALIATCTTAASKARSTIGKSSGKWYWECTVSTLTGPTLGVATSAAPVTTYPGAEATSWAFYDFNGKKYSGGVGDAYNAAGSLSDVVGVALDMDNGTIAFYRNGVALGVAYSGLTGVIFAAVGNSGSTTPTITVNFGTAPLAYAPPAGFNYGLYD
ncbi:SPRY domain-containing protein [Herminiimonas sp. CN]|uniref:SPRY domain-containing protein n=1 Tax=Herminiimonas sp. CN TaxID=1349818 RepID=UPI00350FB9DC